MNLQNERAKKLKNKISCLKIQKKIQFHKYAKNKIGLNKKVDFVPAFYALHKLPSKNNFFKEIKK